MSEQILFNPVTGESMTVLESTSERFKAQYALKPHGSIAGSHFHPNREQCISVISGEMHVRIKGVHHIIRAGESVIIPTGAHHFQWNPNDIEVVAIEEIYPAGRMHEFFATLFNLAKEGKTNAKGYPSPLLAAALISEFKDSIQPAPLPLRLLFGALAPLAEALGYKRLLAKYQKAGGV